MLINLEEILNRTFYLPDLLVTNMGLIPAGTAFRVTALKGELAEVEFDLHRSFFADQNIQVKGCHAAFVERGTVRGFEFRPRHRPVENCIVNTLYDLRADEVPLIISAEYLATV